MSDPDRPLLLLGTGGMARSYAAVLRARGRAFVAGARDAARTAAFAAEEGAQGHVLLPDLQPADVARYAGVVVCTAPESLEGLTERLLSLGARALLVEKPGALSSAALRQLGAQAKAAGVPVRIAANRRFFASVRALRRILEDDPPVCASFDFTEWPERVAASGRRQEVLERWAAVNSVHVIDTLVHLLGPLEIQARRVGDAGALSWHPAGATFSGHGACGRVPVSWATSWICPGRWALEVRTAGGTYRLAPLETLRVRRHGSTGWQTIPPPDAADVEFKPGLFRVVSAFEALLHGGPCELPDPAAFAGSLETVERIVGYAP